VNILAIGAHPDDVELFCAGTLLKYKAAGHKIFVALATSGNIGSNIIEGREEIARVREQETLEAAKYYNADVRFMRYNDEGLVDGEDVRRRVLNTMRWANPDVILTHFPGDVSTDHNMIGSLVARMIQCVGGKNVPADEPPIKKAPSLFFFDTGAGVHFVPETYVDISDVMDMKLEALGKHKSQFAWMSTFEEQSLSDYCRIISEFRGLQAGCRFAEAFHAHRIHSFMPNFKLLP
jgi:LmbE family N-acetylglucosaminyl deacetylase